jgi:hypothetical protein
MTVMIKKKEAHDMIDRLPNSATWDDLIKEIYVRETIERGLSDSVEGRVSEVRDVRAKYGLKK